MTKIPVTEPMFNTGGRKEDLQRCPDCFRLPDLKIEDKGPDKSSFRFICERHGHLADGDTIEGATALWNIYVMSFRKGGPNER